MWYENKMIILSGDGKGVVLIEKSARGLRFSLSTFDMPTCGLLRAGVITPNAVFVRDLPQCDNPAAVFILDCDSTQGLHVAVFDTKLRLYGTNGKPMWESNVMDLLTKNDRKAVAFDRPQPAVLPPISTPPQVLPMPDGTGIPQSRLEIYGDEAIAESDFYTTVDIDSHLPRVDKFLDEPRILDGLAPVIQSRLSAAAETTAIADDDENEQSERISSEVEDMDERETDKIVERMAEVLDAAAAADAPVRPWQMEARWLKTRSTRQIKSEQTSAVKPITNKTQIKPIREISFIERAAADIEKLFDNAEKDDKLCSLLPDIKWVRVPIDNHVISVGRGGNDFLCYAVSGTYEKTSPLGDEAQWLPENKAIPTGKGYWLIFQSLKDGSIIEN